MSYKAGSSSFSGFVPDIIGCNFAGDNFGDTIADTYVAIDAHLEYQTEKGHPLPTAQNITAYDEDCQDGIRAYVDIDLSK
ncbi:type II toxin-antitoxin system HicB family antitoxin [Kluyvera intermedia]|uniref:type II toxin-antitoxin system HicB family antitoxin n=1 Tax=Kluyvera intermedia TaxID=61648 RepID=UPI00352537B1